jgi:hypothetical protein
VPAAKDWAECDKKSVDGFSNMSATLPWVLHCNIEENQTSLNQYLAGPSPKSAAAQARFSHFSQFRQNWVAFDNAPAQPGMLGNVVLASIGP